MLIKFSDWIHRISTGWAALLALVVFVLFTALVLPGQSASAEATAGGAGSPDLSFYYTAEDLYRMAESYGEAGREAYIQARFTFDLIWPVVYTVFLATGVSWLVRKAFAAESPWRLANLVPVVAVSFDYLENISAAVVIARYPSPTAGVDALAGAFTALKWVFVSGSFVLLLAGAAAVLWMQVRSRVG